jgi:hypothetical protein
MEKIYIEPKKSEREYRKLAVLGQKLGVPVPEVFLEIEVRMPDGRVLHHHKQRSHSWVRNGYNILVSNMCQINGSDGAFGAGFINLKTTGGATISSANGCSHEWHNFENADGKDYRGAAGITTNGIVVGSNAAAENFENSALGTLIANGVGAGQLSYVQGDAPVKSYNAGTLTYQVVHVRYMNNNSGGDVIVNEVGIYGSNYLDGSTKAYMVSRDKLGATVTVPNTGQLKVTYTFQTVYPA